MPFDGYQDEAIVVGFAGGDGSCEGIATTAPGFTISNLFDTPAKRWRAAADFGAGLLVAAVGILYFAVLG